VSYSAPRPCRAVLFDKDGTLVDFRATWLPRYRGAAAEIAARAGRPPALAAALLERLGYDPSSGRFAADSPLLWDSNAAVAARWAAMPEVAGRVDAREVADRHFADHDRYPPVGVGDLPALLGYLRRAGLALGLATMDDTANAHDTAARLGIARLLDFVAGADAGHGAKPGPGMALAFCAALGLDPAEVAVVGDTRADLMMARAAGCGLAVAVLTGGTPRQAVEGLADHVLDDVHGLPTFLAAARLKLGPVRA
jgi:phosphoglycolate phosphatase